MYLNSWSPWGNQSIGQSSQTTKIYFHLFTQEIMRKIHKVDRTPIFVRILRCELKVTYSELEEAGEAHRFCFPHGWMNLSEINLSYDTQP